MHCIGFEFNLLNMSVEVKLGGMLDPSLLGLMEGGCWTHHF